MILPSTIIDPLSPAIQARDAEELLDVFGPAVAVNRATHWTGLQYWTPRPVKDLTATMNFMRLNAVAEKFAHIDRDSFLLRLFKLVTGNATSFDDCFSLVYRFVQDAFHHSLVTQPITQDGNLIFDPVILYLLGQGRCGHIARFAIDLLEAGGIEGRLVYLPGHAVAEARDGTEWHLLDADVFRGDDVPRRPDGRFGSVEEWLDMPYELDSFPANVYPLEYTEALFHQFPELREPYRFNLAHVTYPSAGYAGLQSDAVSDNIQIQYEQRRGERGGWDGGWNDGEQFITMAQGIPYLRRPVDVRGLSWDREHPTAVHWPASQAFGEGEPPRYQCWISEAPRVLPYDEFNRRSYYTHLQEGEGATIKDVSSSVLELPSGDGWTISVRTVDLNHPLETKAFTPWSEELRLPDRARQ